MTAPFTLESPNEVPVRINKAINDSASIFFMGYNLLLIFGRPILAFFRRLIKKASVFNFFMPAFDDFACKSLKCTLG